MWGATSQELVVVLCRRSGPVGSETSLRVEDTRFPIFVVDRVERLVVVFGTVDGLQAVRVADGGLLYVNDTL